MQRACFIVLAAILTTGIVLPVEAEAGGLFGAARSAIAKRAIKSTPQATSQAIGKPRDVIILRSRHPEAAAHIEYAQRKGQPTVLHIDRAGADKRRHASIGNIRLERKPAPHYERDEYPPAMTREGGHSANVRFIDRHDNRGAGSSMRAQTRDLDDGAKIRVLVAD